MSVGLDIGTQTIKLVELNREGDRFGLKTAGAVAYKGQRVDQAQSEKELESLIETIKKLVAQTKVGTKEAGLAIPENLSFTRLIKFPLLSEQEIASAIKWEAEQYIPMPIAEAIIQHQVVERRESATPPEVWALLVAVPRALVEKYIKVLTKAGLTTTFVETEMLSLARSLAPAQQTALLLDFGGATTNLGIAKNSQVVFSRSIPTGGEAISRAVAQGLGVAPPQAEEYKKTYGVATDKLEGQVAKVITPVLATMIEEVKKAVHFYQSDQGGEAPTSLVLSGGSAGIPGLVTYLAQQTSLETIIGDPFTRVNVAPEVRQKLSAYLPLYSVAAGLALGG